MIRFLTALAALVCATATLPAEKIYVLMEEGCSDRIRYEQVISSQNRTDYYAYSFLLRNGSRLSLETGVEGSSMSVSLPAGYIGCSNARLHENIAARVGNGIDEVFILRSAFNGQYMVHPVIAASVLRQEGDLLTYTSNLTSFQLDKVYAEIGPDISYLKPSATVVFEGKEPGPCSGALLVQQTQLGGQYPLIQYRISPDIGLLERRLGSDGINTPGSVVQARSVNGVPVLDYIATNCQRLRAGAPVSPMANGANTFPRYPNGTVQPAPPTNSAPASAPSPYSNQPVYTPPAVTIEPESQAYRDRQTASAAPPVRHTVTKGETLYAISKKYNTTPDAIKRGNGMAGNTIFPGQVLDIGGSALAPAPVTPTLASAGAPVRNASLYRTDGKTRIVRAGETVAYVALQSGYTEAKFRSINNLSDTDVLYAGQVVKTDHCDCPSVTPPSAYNTSPAPITLPNTPYNQPSATPEPQPYGSSPAADPYLSSPPAYQPANPAYTAPAPTSYGAPRPNYAPGNTSDYQPATPAPTYKAPVYNNSSAPAQTMTQLESRGAAPAGATYRNAAPVNADPRPGTYKRPVAVGDQFRGTELKAAPKSADLPTADGSPAYSRKSHIVQEGESIWAIAQRYGLTTDKLRELNGMTGSDVPAPFQKLYVE